MAYDLKHTNERVAILNECSRTLKHIATLCRECQNYHDGTSDYVNRADNVNARMASVKSAIEDVVDILTDLASDKNMAFQFEWVVGKHNIEDIFVNSASNTAVLRHEGGQTIDSSFTNALSATDRVRLVGSATSLHPTVASLGLGAQSVYFEGNPLQTTESLLSRIIKEMGGE